MEGASQGMGSLRTMMRMVIITQVNSQADLFIYMLVHLIVLGSVIQTAGCQLQFIEEMMHLILTFAGRIEETCNWYVIPCTSSINISKEHAIT